MGIQGNICKMTDIPGNGMFMSESFKVHLVYQRSSSKVSNFAITEYGVEQYRHLNHKFCEVLFAKFP